MCGVGTEVIAGEGLILTAGGFDAHIHFTCPQLAEEAIASGLTTMVGGGTGTDRTCDQEHLGVAYYLRALVKGARNQ